MEPVAGAVEAGVTAAAGAVAGAAAEAALRISPDAALNEIAEAPVAAVPGTTPVTMPGETMPPEGSMTPEGTSPGPTVAETEEAMPTAETPKIPGKVAENPDFRKRRGDLYAKDKQESGEV